MRPKSSRFPIPCPGPSHFSGYMVADGYDGCITQLQDLEHLTTHDSQCSPGDKGCPSQYTLQNTLGHCQRHHRGRSVREESQWWGGKEEQGLTWTQRRLLWHHLIAGQLILTLKHT